ncbi:MAG: hypothetical protein KME14_20470 [Tildeniella torsiva UHER 1998/13D]|jgi:hypothetical protein|nr:hypothetical protein [Tildeniella torsiva UHER 1998/13D]
MRLLFIHLSHALWLCSQGYYLRRIEGCWEWCENPLIDPWSAPWAGTLLALTLSSYALGDDLEPWEGYHQ